MKKQSSENKLVITEEFIFDQNKFSKDQNNHFKLYWLNFVIAHAQKKDCYTCQNWS